MRKSTPSNVVGIAPTDWAPSASTGTPLRSRSSRQREHGSGRPEHLRGRDQPRPRRDGREDRVRVGLDDDHTGRRGADRAEQPEVLVGRRHDLVLGPEAQAAEHDRAALGRRVGQSDLGGVGVHERRERGPRLVPEREGLLEVRDPAPAPAEIVGDSAGERLRDRTRERTERPRVQVRDGLEDGKQPAVPPRASRRPDLDACLDDGVVGEHDAILHAALPGPRDDRARRGRRARARGRSRRPAASTRRGPDRRR